ncbi:MAG: hypothetical protein M1822_005280 [Bathelium mastoideum]|nr:MAG: hypothetical protein M1822_005280 [Bathelium mastoideum]
MSQDFSSFALFTAGLAALSSLASAQTPPPHVPTTNIGNPTFTPTKNESIEIGSTFDITWDDTQAPAGCGTVSLLLLNGCPSDCVQEGNPISTSQVNNGKFSWTVDGATLPDPAGEAAHGIQIICDGNGDFQWSPSFALTKPASSPPPPNSGNTPPPPPSNPGNPQPPPTTGNTTTIAPPSNITTTTVYVTDLTTVCPVPTTATYGSHTITVSSSTTLTITDCSCTVTETKTPGLPYRTLGSGSGSGSGSGTGSGSGSGSGAGQGSTVPQPTPQPPYPIPGSSGSGSGATSPSGPNGGKGSGGSYGSAPSNGTITTSSRPSSGVPKPTASVPIPAGNGAGQLQGSAFGLVGVVAGLAFLV